MKDKRVAAAREFLDTVAAKNAVEATKLDRDYGLFIDRMRSHFSAVLAAYDEATTPTAGIAAKDPDVFDVHADRGMTQAEALDVYNAVVAEPGLERAFVTMYSLNVYVPGDRNARRYFVKLSERWVTEEQLRAMLRIADERGRKFSIVEKEMKYE
jgi:hypothetical protein